MSTWQPASSVFSGGTQEIKALLGRRVRTTASISGLLVYDPNPAQKKHETFDLSHGRVGFVGHSSPQRHDLLVAFPINRSSNPPSLEALSRSGSFKVVVVNAPTFKHKFEIEAS